MLKKKKEIPTKLCFTCFHISCSLIKIIDSFLSRYTKCPQRRVCYVSGYHINFRKHVTNWMHDQSFLLTTTHARPIIPQSSFPQSFVSYYLIAWLSSLFFTQNWRGFWEPIAPQHCVAQPMSF